MKASSEVTLIKIFTKLKHLLFPARFPMEGVLSGIHKSPQKGASVEFAHYKEYAQGDDFRHIDWKVFGRTDKYYIKQFEQETNLKAMILLDTSRSMKYASESLSKLDYGIELCKVMSYLLLKQKDAVGLTTFSDTRHAFIPPRTNWTHLELIRQTLATVEPHGKTACGNILLSLAEKLPGRSMLILISDLFDDPDQIIKALSLIRKRRAEIIIFHLLDPAEYHFPFRKLMQFQDIEGNQRIMVDPLSIKEKYQTEMAQFLKRYQDFCQEYQIDYHWILTDTPLEKNITQFLGKRNLRRRPAGG
jgi:uncharacterized protein (DUF58 family)